MSKVEEVSHEMHEMLLLTLQQVCHGRACGKSCTFCKRVHFWKFLKCDMASFRVAGVALRDMWTCLVTCWTKCSPEVPAQFFLKKHNPRCSHLSPAFGDVSRSEMRCIKTLAPQIGHPNSAKRVYWCSLNIFGGESLATWWILFGALVHGEVCCEISVDFLRGKYKQIKICRFFANFAAYPNYTLAQKLRWQNFAGKNSPTKSRQLFAVDK